MTETFDKLKALLTEKQDLTNEDVETVVKEHGEMTDEEKIWLESEKIKLQKSERDEVSLDDYLAALKVLDEAEEGSAEHSTAKATVDKYESGG